VFGYGRNLMPLGPMRDSRSAACGMKPQLGPRMCARTLYLYTIHHSAVDESRRFLLLRPFVMSTSDRSPAFKGQKRCTAPSCSKIFGAWDDHAICTACRTCSAEHPCETCLQWSPGRWSRAAASRSYRKRKTPEPRSRSQTPAPRSRSQTPRSRSHTPVSQYSEPELEPTTEVRGGELHAPGPSTSATPPPPQPSQLFISPSLRENLLSQVRGEFSQDIATIRTLMARLSGYPPIAPAILTEPTQQMPLLYPQPVRPATSQIPPDLSLLPDDYNLVLDPSWVPHDDSLPPAQQPSSQPDHRWGGPHRSVSSAPAAASRLEELGDIAALLASGSSSGSDPRTAGPDPRTAGPDPRTAGPDPRTAGPTPDSRRPDPDNRTSDPDNRPPGPDILTPDPDARPPGPDNQTAAPLESTGANANKSYVVQTVQTTLRTSPEVPHKKLPAPDDASSVSGHSRDRRRRDTRRDTSRSSRDSSHCRHRRSRTRYRSRSYRRRSRTRSRSRTRRHKSRRSASGRSSRSRSPPRRRRRSRSRDSTRSHASYRTRKRSRSPSSDRRRARRRLQYSTSRSPSRSSRRRSRSCSSRRRSRSDERGSPTRDDLKYEEIISLLRSLFPEHITTPPTPKKTTSVLGVAPPTEPSAYSSLPWAPSADALYTSLEDQVSGKDPKAKSSGAAGLAPGSFLKRPSTRERHYRLSASPWAYASAQLPPRFASLQRSAKTTPSATMTQADLVSQETALKQLAGTLSHLHWFLGGALRTSDPDHPTTLDAAQSRALLLAGQKAGSEALRWTSYLLGNTVLTRRDAFLSTMHKDVEPAERRRLRQHPFRDRYLFSPTSTEDVFRSFQETTQTRTLSSVFARGSGSRRASPRRQQPPSQRGQQRPANPPGGRPAARTAGTGRGRPQTGGKSFQKKRGGGQQKRSQK